MTENAREGLYQQDVLAIGSYIKRLSNVNKERNEICELVIRHEIIVVLCRQKHNPQSKAKCQSGHN